MWNTAWNWILFPKVMAHVKLRGLANRLNAEKSESIGADVANTAYAATCAMLGNLDEYKLRLGRWTIAWRKAH